MILAADVGGTKTSIGISDSNNPTYFLRKKTFQNLEFNSFIEIVQHFIKHDEIEIIVLGVAGPIFSRSVDLTNLNWTIDADQLEKEFNCSVYLLNDLQAAAYFIPHINEKYLDKVHNADETRNSNISVIVASGTGLGVATLIRGNENQVYPSEGGHIGFSPKSEFQNELFTYLQKREKHVSCEMMASSVGFKNLTDFIINTEYFKFSTKFIENLSKSNHPSKFIVEVIKNYENDYTKEDLENCNKIVNEISFILGSFIGDLSLLHLPNAIYLTGGIGGNIVSNKFLHEGFIQKSNMSHIIKNTNLFLIKEIHIALYGCSLYAASKLKSIK